MFSGRVHLTAFFCSLFYLFIFVLVVGLLLFPFAISFVEVYFSLCVYMFQRPHWNGFLFALAGPKRRDEYKARPTKRPVRNEGENCTAREARHFIYLFILCLLGTTGSAATAKPVSGTERCRSRPS